MFTPTLCKGGILASSVAYTVERARFDTEFRCGRCGFVRVFVNLNMLCATGESVCFLIRDLDLSVGFRVDRITLQRALFLPVLLIMLLLFMYCIICLVRCGCVYLEDCLLVLIVFNVVCIAHVL